jgi:hypothetical protein
VRVSRKESIGSLLLCEGRGSCTRTGIHGVVLGAQVYVSASKHPVLNTLGWPPEYEALLTTDDRARLHAVPLWRVSLKHMACMLKHYRGRNITIVGYQPTGWSMRSGSCLHQSQTFSYGSRDLGACGHTESECTACQRPDFPQEPH